MAILHRQVRGKEQLSASLTRVFNLDTSNAMAFLYRNMNT